MRGKSRLIACSVALLVAFGSAFAGGEGRRVIPQSSSWGVGAGFGRGHWGGSVSTVWGGSRCGSGWGSGVVVGGSGLSIGVGYTSRHWGVGISLNDVWSRYDCRPRYEPLICSTPVGYTVPVVYTQPVVVERPVVYTTPVVVTQTGTAWTSPPVQAVTPVVVTPPAASPAASPAPASPQASPPPTDFERGVLALQANDIAYSIAALRKHLREHADDARAMRVLAVALLADKQADDAAGLMRAALRTDAKLAGEPVSPLGLGFSERRFRDLVTRAVDQANNVNTSGAWLLVATLMQAEGRDDKALGMLERARAQGLERDLYDAMVVELKR